MSKQSENLELTFPLNWMWSRMLFYSRPHYYGRLPVYMQTPWAVVDWFTYANGHSRIAVEEMAIRMGALTGFRPILSLGLTSFTEHADPEYSKWPVTEGFAVLKHKGVYYLFYTGNHFLSPKYAVGYATSSSPTGPWTKYEGNPILKQTNHAVGIGSGEFIRNPAGELLFFHHAHYNSEKVAPRRVVYSKVNFVHNEKEAPDLVKISNKKYFPRTIREK